MTTLADAWSWYEATKLSLLRIHRLGANHWSDPSLDSASIWQDEHFKTLEAGQIVTHAETSLAPIDDLAVVVLFSVFESRVRDFLIELIEPHAANITDAILKEAANEAIQGVQDGSFYRRVLEPLKKQQRVSAHLVTQVDQVRDFRNWVAHGMREAPTNNVTPQQAYERLRDFLAALGISEESEHRDDGDQAAV
jgi:hypothetical protein